VDMLLVASPERLRSMELVNYLHFLRTLFMSSYVNEMLTHKASVELQGLVTHIVFLTTNGG
jgi:hypothetical protein